MLDAYGRDEITFTYGKNFVYAAVWQNEKNVFGCRIIESGGVQKKR